MNPSRPAGGLRIDAAFAGFLFVAVSLLGPSRCAGETIDRDAFLRDLNQAGRRAKEAARNILVRGTLETKSLKGEEENPGKDSETSLVYARRSGYEMFDYSTIAEDDEVLRRVLLQGPQGEYVLRQSLGEPDLYLEFTEIPPKFRSAMEYSTRAAVYPAFVLYLCDIRDMLNSSNTKIHALDVLEREGRRLYVIDFSTTEKKRIRGDDADVVTRGRITLDPALCYAVRDYEIETYAAKQPDQNVKASGRVDYFDEPSLPRASLVVQETRHWHGQHRRHIFRSDEWSYREVEPGTFTLDHFGLGDFAKPVGGGRSRASAWAWAVAVLFVPAILLVHRLGRRKPAPG